MISLNDFLLFYCRVCGFHYEEGDNLPWGKNGKEPSFDNCICCSAEFGFHDYTIDDIRKYRQRWIEEGAIFYIPSRLPVDWDYRDQLTNIPKEFL